MELASNIMQHKTRLSFGFQNQTERVRIPSSYILLLNCPHQKLSTCTLFQFWLLYSPRVFYFISRSILRTYEGDVNDDLRKLYFSVFCWEIQRYHQGKRSIHRHQSLYKLAYDELGLRATLSFNSYSWAYKKHLKQLRLWEI